jgi:hypothetical protein
VVVKVDAQAAREAAFQMLGHTGDRWLHSQAAAAAATRAATTVVEEDRGLLIAAAWVHDVGYHHPDPPTGFHPLDGALWLLDAGWPRRLAALVAHHSAARYAAAARGLIDQLNEFPREDGPVSDALTYADLTSGPDGRPMTLERRLADIQRRHAADPVHICEARRARTPHLIGAYYRVVNRMDQSEEFPRRGLVGASGSLLPRAL